ncbi:hypothetical protein NEOLEDRAFT_1127725 [Neolentinus lepideus HHB14362 ss-1]|uniref:Uncharacterized protein n=1 Tax=Neolentinus lepideus HHB14362 ss-1 TaxID=1314782 RepID=A0A165VLD9_9AGAM|nr:hypothetical protein NEOLEDRAFT_1127725 [Neolentinus lepideus HHB14362 ss-1]
MYSIARRTALRTVAGLNQTAVASTKSAYTTRTYSTMHDNDPELLEREKHRNLQGTQHETSTPIHNAPGWNETLGSTSEANIKADRSAHNDPETMQKHTVDYVQSRHHPEERLSRREAGYPKDEVAGPLSSAGSTGGVDPDDVLTTDGTKVKVTKETREKTSVVKEVLNSQ